jgi:hypothetical protein
MNNRTREILRDLLYAAANAALIAGPIGALVFVMGFSIKFRGVPPVITLVMCIVLCIGLYWGINKIADRIK